MKTDILRCLLVSACATGLVGPASAHAHLVETNPIDHAVAKSSPDVVSLRFSGGVEASVSSISISGADGTTIPVDDPVFHELSKTLTVHPGVPLEAGTYSVRWKALSRDGHPVSGSFTFTVSP